MISFCGDWFAFVAVSGFVTDVTGRPGLAAVVYAASVLPIFVLSPVAGLIADRVDRKRMLVWVDVLRVPPSLGLLLAMHWSSPALAIGCVLVLAALSTFFEPVAAAVVPNVLGPEELALGQAALSSVWGSMLFVGAALGGAVSAVLGREAAFVFNALTFVASAVLVWRIRRPLQEERAQGHDGGLGDVWSFVRKGRVTRSLFATKAGVGLANGIVGLLPAFALARYGKGDASVGVLLAGRGLGALIGPYVANRLVRGDGRRLIFICGASILTYGMAYALLPLAASVSLAFLFIAVAHMGGGAQWALSTYGLQRSTPDSLRGRVLSLDFGLATLAIGLSSLGAAAAVERVSLEAACWGLSLAALIYGACWLFWTRPLWSASSDPLRE